MPYLIYQDEVIDISLMVIAGSPRVRKSISMDLHKPLATQEFTFSLRDDFFQGGQRFRPLTGQRVQWFTDDDDQEKLFDGFITSCPSQYMGKDAAGNNILRYEITAKDPTWLLEHKKISGVFENVYSGDIIDQFAAVADPRLTPAFNNDRGTLIKKLELSLVSYKDAIEEFAKGSGLMVWVDENFNIHHKDYANSSIASL
jgi:hypothetical protein